MIHSNLCKLFEVLSEEEAKCLSEWQQLLRAGYLEWKRTGRLPNNRLFVVTTPATGDLQ